MSAVPILVQREGKHLMSPLNFLSRRRKPGLVLVVALHPLEWMLPLNVAFKCFCSAPVPGKLKESC